jgi:hypothetical protein
MGMRGSIAKDKYITLDGSFTVEPSIFLLNLISVYHIANKKFTNKTEDGLHATPSIFSSMFMDYTKGY